MQNQIKETLKLAPDDKGAMRPKDMQRLGKQVRRKSKKQKLIGRTGGGRDEAEESKELRGVKQ